MPLFKKRKINQNGFSHIELALCIVVVVAVTAIGYFVYQKNGQTNLTVHAGSEPQILYAKGYNGSGSIWESDVNGGKAQLVSGSYSYPVWAKNATLIYFEGELSGPTASSQIYSATPSGSNVTAVGPQFYGYINHLSWSEKAQKLMFTSSNPGTQIDTVYSMTPSGVLTKLYSGKANGALAQWSPNGLQVMVYVSGIGGPGQGNRLLVMNSNGSKAVVLPTYTSASPCYNSSDPNGIYLSTNSHNSWSPSGQQIVFSYGNQNGACLMVINAVDGKSGWGLKKLLTVPISRGNVGGFNGGGDYDGPEWLSNQHIIFFSQSGGQFGLNYYYNLAPGAKTAITTGTFYGDVFDFDASPDGTYISTTYQNSAKTTFYLNDRPAAGGAVRTLDSTNVQDGINGLDWSDQ